LSHSFDTGYSLQNALDEIREFLEENPSEFVIIYSRIDHWWREDRTQGRRGGEILKVLESSNIKLADVDGDSIQRVCVSDVAGQVILMLPDNNSVLPSNCGLSFIDSRKFYNVFDVWKLQSLNEAMMRLDEHMISRVKSHGLSHLAGVALDISVTGLPPSWTSHKLNEWFMSKLEKDSKWSCTEPPIGVLMLDFADEKLVRRLLSIVGLGSNSDQV
jgi:hypothetical protein